MICLGDKKYLVASGVGFFREPAPPEPYYIRGTGTPNSTFSVTISCVDETSLTSTDPIEEDVLIGSNGEWEIAYTGKKISSLSNAFKNVTDIVSLEFTEDLSEVTTLASMCNGCSSLTSLDFGDDANFSKVTTCVHMFKDCALLTTISNLNKTTLQNLNAVTNMFYGCSSLTSIDLSNMTFNGTLSGSMFRGCSSLTSIDLSGSIFGNTTTATSMFYGCTSLLSVDLRNATFASATSYGSFFSNCGDLETIRFDSVQASYSVLSNMINSIKKVTTGTHQMIIDEDNFTTIYTSQEQQDIEDALNNKGWTLTLT